METRKTARAVLINRGDASKETGQSRAGKRGWVLLAAAWRLLPTRLWNFSGTKQLAGMRTPSSPVTPALLQQVFGKREQDSQ